jgi:hypothetical protein
MRNINLKIANYYQVNKTLNTETIIEVKPKKRGRPKKVIVENLEK